MQKHPDSGDDHDLTGEHTGEFPALAGPPADGSERSRAEDCLAHLENELARLNAKWQTVDDEFKSREARIAALRRDVEQRETAIAGLNAALQREAAALRTAGQALADKDGEIAMLIHDRTARDERIAALTAQLADAAEALKATLVKVARAESEVEHVKDFLRQEQAASAGIGRRNEQLLAEQQQLLSKLQDLEIYVNGRHASWSELNTRLASYETVVNELEEGVKTRDAVIARHDDEKNRLSGRIADLQRQCAELTRQGQEHEAAQAALRQKLAAQIEATEKLEQATKSAAQELASAKGELVSRTDELEKAQASSAQQLEAVRQDLRMSHDQLRAAQDTLAERTKQLASTQQAADQKTRHIERLSNDLAAMHRDAARARAELDELAARASELEAQRSQAAAESEQLRNELAAQHKRVATLETELRATQATADLLERSVSRISDLGARVAALDERMHLEPGAAQADKPAAASMDFAETVAADERVEAAADEVAELLPMALLLGDKGNGEASDGGEHTDAEAPRKLVAIIGGESVHYPIFKRLMTIGRGHGSDIRIPSHFVSRLHAKISTNELATVIEDVGSKNGTLVNAKRVRRRILRNGDVVSLGGDLNLRFVDATH